MKTQKATVKKAAGGLKPSMLFLVFTILMVISCGRNKTISADNQPQPEKVATADSVYQKVDVLPVFKGGDQELIKYIADSTRYPEEAMKNKSVGKVLVKFVVEKDCNISEVEVIKGVDPLLDAEAVRVVSSLPKFEKPGIQAGSPVRVQFILPITFTLN
jgi:periplasmic protein TonB